MALQVDKSSTGLENMYSLVQYTWPELINVLTPTNIKISAPLMQDPEDPEFEAKVTITPESNRVVGTKTVTYTALILNDLAPSPFEADDLDNANIVLNQYLDTLPCVREELDVGPLGETEPGVITVTISAMQDAYTVFGTFDVTINIPVSPDLDLDGLDGGALDGFGETDPTP